MSKFVRPHTMSYPTVYHTFQARDLDKKFVEYRFQDFPKDRYDEGIQFMIDHFFDREPMAATRKVSSDAIAVEECSQIWRESLAKGLSIACFKQNSDEIIAMNILLVSSVNIKEDTSEVI